MKETTEKPRGGCLYGLMLLAGVIFFLLGAGELIYGIFGSPITAFYDNDPADKVNGVFRMMAARGRSTSWEFASVTESVKGYWATSKGLAFYFKNQQTGAEIKVPAVPPTEKSWGDSINASSTANDVRLNGSFTLPDVPPPETQSLDGRLTGEIYFPKHKEWSGGDFTNESKSLDIPVKLEIIAPDQFDTMIKARWWRYWRNALLLFFGGAVLIVAFIVFYFRATRGER